MKSAETFHPLVKASACDVEVWLAFPHWRISNCTLDVLNHIGNPINSAWQMHQRPLSMYQTLPYSEIESNVCAYRSLSRTEERKSLFDRVRRMYCKVIRTFRRSPLNLFVKRRLNAKNNTPLNIRFEISSSWTRIFSSQCLHWNAHRSIKRILSIRSNRLAACLNDIEAWPDRIESDLVPFQHKKLFFRVVKPYVSQKKYYLSETFLVISKIKRWALKTV